MKRITALIVTICLLVFCLTSCKSKNDETETKTESKTESKKEAQLGVNLIETGAWRPAADSYGSSYEVDENIVVNDEIEIRFTIAKKTEPDMWPYVELICETGAPLTGAQGLEITYWSEKELKIKLSQSDFGPNGDNTYAHYQIKVESAAEWTTATVYFNDFKQPDWAPEESTKIALNLDNVNDIYLVPGLDYEIGDSSTFGIKSLVLK